MVQVIEWNYSNLKKIDTELIKALNKTAVDTLTDITINGVVPFDVGTLEKQGGVSKAESINDSASVYWSQPYAAKLYFNPEFNFQNGRKGRWADSWIFGGKRKFVLNAFIKNAKR